MKSVQIRSKREHTKQKKNEEILCFSSEKEMSCERKKNHKEKENNNEV
jgi:hypothetical protein